jgi:hypothetical protein
VIASPTEVVLAWCRQHRALIRYGADGGVEVRVGKVARRAPDLAEAWAAMVDAGAGR